METEIKMLRPDDLSRFRELIMLFEDVLEMENFTIPDDNHLQKLLGNEAFFVFVAMHVNKVIGGLTAYLLQQYYSVKPLVYVYDLAVKREHQRMGVGKKLMAGITGFCREKGMEEVFVQADEIDRYAVDFYRSTGATPEKVVHFYYPLNVD